MGSRRIGYTQRPDEVQITVCDLVNPQISKVGKSVNFQPSLFFLRIFTLSNDRHRYGAEQGDTSDVFAWMKTARRELRVYLGLSAGISHAYQRVRT